MAVECPDLDLLQRYDRPGPRYTSYPTAPNFGAGGARDHAQALERSRVAHPSAPLSVYVHAPFCADPCFYCGCTRVITRDAARIERYVDQILREIRLQASVLGRTRPVEQVHLGGGTPTAFTDAQLDAVLRELRRGFGAVEDSQQEFSIEIDPRTVDATRLARLAAMGFNRISLGVQDFEPDVQAAIHRIQPVALTTHLLHAARLLGLRSVSFDLVYGLPRQTEAGFERTLQQVVRLRPDRVAIYGYAHLPQQFKAQGQIRLNELPDPTLRLRLFQQAAQRLTEAGYVAVGLDHFARPGDELVQALEHGRLQRNFQGYSTRAGLDLIGVGLSSISRIGGAYTQNARTLEAYASAIEAGVFATQRVCVLSDEDRLRSDVIGALMCSGEVSFDRLSAQHGRDVRSHLAPQIARLQEAANDGLIQIQPGSLRVTPRGRYFLRQLAMPFDAYLEHGAVAGSRAA